MFKQKKNFFFQISSSRLLRVVKLLKTSEKLTKSEKVSQVDGKCEESIFS